MPLRRVTSNGAGVGSAVGGGAVVTGFVVGAIVAGDVVDDGAVVARVVLDAARRVVDVARVLDDA